ncbi:MAG: hypothetical protein WAW30_00130 [Patescibacteria group bacterium]
MSKWMIFGDILILTISESSYNAGSIRKRMKSSRVLFFHYHTTFMSFEKVVTDITEFFPKNEEIFSREFSDVDEFMERLSHRATEILQEN